jgi:hypothetical protein
MPLGPPEDLREWPLSTPLEVESASDGVRRITGVLPMSELGQKRPSRSGLPHVRYSAHSGSPGTLSPCRSPTIGKVVGGSEAMMPAYGTRQ